MPYGLSVISALSAGHKETAQPKKKGCTFLKDAALESITNDRYGTTRQQTEQRGRYGNKHL